MCVFFLRDLFLHYIIITIFINSSKLSTLLVLMKIDLHWRRECLHVKSKPAIYNVCYLIKLNNILFCIATLQSCMKQPSFHLKLSWAFTCTCLRAYLGDDRAKKNKILTNIINRKVSLFVCLFRFRAVTTESIALKFCRRKVRSPD